LRVFIHGGLPKTGSTAIQASLFASRDSFRPCDMLLPVFRANMPGHHFLARLRMVNNPGKVFQASPEFERLDGIKAKFVDCLDEASSSNMDVVLSTESFSSEGCVPSAQDVRELIEARGGKIFVLAYIRPPLKHIPSAISQDVRAVDDGPPIEKKIFAHIERAARLRRAFGEDNVEFRVFDRSVLAGGDIVPDFVEWMRRKGAPMPDMRAGEAQNEAISAAACAMLWYMKERMEEKGIQSDDTFKPIRKLALSFDRANPGAKLSLPEAWIDPLTGLVAGAWNELLASAANPEAERERFRLTAPHQNAAARSFSKTELFTPYLDRAYIADVAAFGLGSDKGPLRKAAKRLKATFGV
jgi:hypothetical protein